MIFLLETPFWPLFCLFGSLVLTGCSASLLRLGKFKSKEWLRSKGASLFFFRPFLHWFFPKHEWENLYFSISLCKQFYQLAYAVFAFFYCVSFFPGMSDALFTSISPDDWGPLLALGGSIIGVAILVDCVARLSATIWSKPLLQFSAPFASLFMTLLLPLLALLLQVSRRILRHSHVEEESAELLADRSKLKEMILESELEPHLDSADQKWIGAFVNFKERVAKEIMVPRVNLFALDEETSIQDAVRLFAQEGYSRVPIYRETLDEITGVILYKDLLKCYSNPHQNLKAPLKNIAKSVLYAPENKKIAHLLQEFRNRQIHMAIVVDEYGGTEGIVTIEDILEELVGNIEDESDIGEDQQFWELPDGGWVVDAKMSIHDIEGQLGIQIPANAEYETIGGYVFHCAGTIPTKGWRLSHDDFDLEVLSSNERSLKKIKILPRK